MRLEKIRHGGVGALRCGRFREHRGESVGELFRLVHVEKLGLQTVFLQCRGKVAAVMAEEVSPRAVTRKQGGRAAISDGFSGSMYSRNGACRQPRP